MASERIEVGIVLDPRLSFVIGVRKQTFEQIESRFYFAHERVDTGNIILSKNVVRVDGQCSRYPFSGTVRLSYTNESSGA